CAGSRGKFKIQIAINGVAHRRSAIDQSTGTKLKKNTKEISGMGTVQQAIGFTDATTSDCSGGRMKESYLAQAASKVACATPNYGKIDASTDTS
ncbi:hypothetical protein QC761_0049720, partial [Podospora bellae-mahoneyi]